MKNPKNTGIGQRMTANTGMRLKSQTPACLLHPRTRPVGRNLAASVSKLVRVKLLTGSRELDSDRSSEPIRNDRGGWRIRCDDGLALE
jgi:hypothetical protein